jgi:trans-aconitate 2-methyltransferase
VVDIGCGPGNSTEVLLGRYPNAVVEGIDTSPEMLDAARLRLPSVVFRQADIRTWEDPGPFDVILANAVLQWLPDHETLLPALVARLAPGGSLCVQMPDNLDEPAVRAIAWVAASGPWAEGMAGVDDLRTTIRSAAWYHGLLRPHSGCVNIWRTVYHQVLPDTRAVVEWFRGSALRPYLERLDTPAQTAFLTRYEAAVADVLETVPGGGVLLPYPRLFLVATRADEGGRAAGSATP